MRRLWMAACAGAVLAGTPGVPLAQEAAPLSACIATLRQELRAHPEVSPQTFDTHTREVRDLRPVIENATRAQPEFQIPIWDYLTRRVDAQRIAEGRALLRQESAALAGIAQRQRVDPPTTVAVLGIE